MSIRRPIDVGRYGAMRRMGKGATWWAKRVEEIFGDSSETAREHLRGLADAEPHDDCETCHKFLQLAREQQGKSYEIWGEGEDFDYEGEYGEVSYEQQVSESDSCQICHQPPKAMHKMSCPVTKYPRG